MINNLEQEIVKNFIIKEKQERFLIELSNPKKRPSVIYKLSGTKYFKPSCLRITVSPFRTMVKQMSIKHQIKEVYFLGESYIGFLNINNAIEKVETGERCVVYFTNGEGYYQGEIEMYKASKFLLHLG